MKSIVPPPWRNGANPKGSTVTGTAAVVALSTALLVGLPHQQAPAQSAPQLALPVACEVHVDCWIAKYFDVDPGEDARDYTGGPRTTNNHNGIDFAIRDLAAMNAGVPVRAAADGWVRSTVNGIEDVNIQTIDRDSIEGYSCGNGIVISHGPDWMTRYCHLRMGSVRVAKDQRVKTGDVIGLVGQSGLTEFPHLHFMVLHKRKPVDPFSIDDGTGGRMQIWAAAAQQNLRYEPTSVFALGFREAVPGKKQVDLGDIPNQAIMPDSPAILLWTGIFGARAGDRIRLTVHGPDDKIVAGRDIEQRKNAVRRFVWIGKKREELHWPPGEYTGRVRIISADRTPRERHVKTTKVTVPAASGNQP